MTAAAALVLSFRICTSTRSSVDTLSEDLIFSALDLLLTSGATFFTSKEYRDAVAIISAQVGVFWQGFFDFINSPIAVIAFVIVSVIMLTIIKCRLSKINLTEAHVLILSKIRMLLGVHLILALALIFIGYILFGPNFIYRCTCVDSDILLSIHTKT